MTGPFGYSAAGLKILLRKKKTNKNFQKKQKNWQHFRPIPKLKFGLKNSKFFHHQWILVMDYQQRLNEMSKQSKKQFVNSKLPAQNRSF